MHNLCTHLSIKYLMNVWYFLDAVLKTPSTVGLHETPVIWCTPYWSVATHREAQSDGGCGTHMWTWPRDALSVLQIFQKMWLETGWDCNQADGEGVGLSPKRREEPESSSQRTHRKCRLALCAEFLMGKPRFWENTNQVPVPRTLKHTILHQVRHLVRLVFVTLHISVTKYQPKAS